MKIEIANQIEASQINSNQNSQKKEQIEKTGNDAIFSIDKTARRLGVFGDATYEKPEKETTDVLQDIENQASVQDATQMKNEMVVAANTTSKEDCKQMQEDGFSLNSTEIETVVTVTDKIKMQLAKAGKDISYFGDDLSEAQLEEMTGNAGLAQQLAQTIEKADLPANEENIQDTLETVSMAQELTTPGDGAVKYMLDNSLSPSVENLYKAEFSGSAGYQAPEQNDSDYEQLMPQITEVIKQSGLTVSKQTVEDSKWMIANEIPLTSENLTYLTDLKSMSLPPETEQVVTAAVTAIAEGGRPQEAMLMSGYSLTDQANHALEVVNSATDEELTYIIENDMELTVGNLETAKNAVTAARQIGSTAAAGTNTVQSSSEEQNDAADTAADSSTQQQATSSGLTLLSARRQLEEIRLAMTSEANYALLKKGISIDTKPLAELVEDLKAQENDYYRSLLVQGGIEAGEEAVSTFRNTVETVDELKSMPAYTLGIKTADIDTLSGLHTAGTALKDTLEKAGQSYETMQTSVRKDLGDSIQKAFSNVDDILEDLGLETSEANERSVRILAYNSQSITEESILETKAADEAVQRAFKNLTPAVVREMIRSGENPLDKDITELNEEAVQIKQELGGEEEERFSKYLWKLEQNQTISEEERSSYIGIYRLMNQVEKTDGAAIGSLLAQGGELTMRNLLTQVRSSKHSGMDYSVDDAFEGVSTSNSENLSITEQIEKGYQTNCIRDITDILTPENMQGIVQNDKWQEMTPEQLLQTLTAAEEDAAGTELEDSYFRQQRSDLDACAEAPDEAYQLLKDSNMPNTVQNILAASELIKDRNASYKRFFEEDSEDTADGEEVDFAAIKEDLLKQFGEAVKTPEDMAKAQKALADTAENVMKSMLVESRTVNSLDIRAMKLLNTQLSFATASAEEENYAIPVLVGDEVTNVSLKIVRGKDQKGLVDVLFSTDSLGKVAAQLKATSEGISGYVASDRASTTEWLQENGDVLTAALQDEAEGTADIRFITSEGLKLSGFGKTADEQTQEDDGDMESRQIQTKTLYHMAESFLKTVKLLAAE